MKVRAPELVGHGGWIGVGGTPTLETLRGKVVILHFATYACAKCLRVEDDLAELQARFSTEVVVLGVNSPKFPHAGDPAAVRRAVARERITHPVLDDPDMVTWSQYGVRGWPTVVVIDPLGDVAGLLAGDGQGPVLHQVVHDLVGLHRAQGTLRRARIELDPPAPVTVKGPLFFPAKVATDRRGRLVIADTGHDRVLVVELTGEATGRVTHVVSGVSKPQGVRLYGPELVICDTGGDRVMRVDLSRRPAADEVVVADPAGVIHLRALASEVIAGDLASPWDVTADVDHSLVVAEAARHRLWRIPTDGSSPAVIAGDQYEGMADGPATDAELAQPSGVARLPNGIAFVDAETSALRLLSPGGKVGTLVGEGLFDWGNRDGRSGVARLQHPQGVAAAPDGSSLYVADTYNHAIRWWRDRKLVTVWSEGLCEPGGLDMLPDGRLVVADTGHHRVCFVDLERGEITPLHLELLRLAPERPEPMWSMPLSATPGGPLRVPFAVDLGHYDLDPRDPAPVRVEVSCEPTWLIDHGPTGWTHVLATGQVTVQGGSIGSGYLSVAVSAAVCTEGAATIRRSLTRHPLSVR